MALLHVLQDGADFYVHADAALEKLIRVATAPEPIKDFDMTAAIAAREWFNENGYFKGADEVVWH